MIAELKHAIVERISAVPGIASCEEYTGQLEERSKGRLRLPCVLIHFGDVAFKHYSNAEHSDENPLIIEQGISAYLIVEHARDKQRANSVEALVQTLLPVIHSNPFIQGASIAKLGKVQPRYMLEPNNIAVREISWTQDIKIGGVAFAGDTVSELIFNNGEVIVQ